MSFSLNTSLSTVVVRSTIVGKIIQRIDATSCTVKDWKGRLFTVSYDGSYSVGKYVLVKDGVVVGLTNRISNYAEYQV